MIEIKNISKSFGSNIALNNVSTSIKEGKIVALIGENGAGKSTLMRIMCGYLSATKGEVLIYGNSVEANRINALKYIGYVPEISSLYGDMIVYDFLKWVANVWNIKFIDKVIYDVANQMQILDVLTQKIDNLSKGYKKRVEIASALIHSPKILILDEPTDGLDPNQKYEIRNFIKNYSKDNIVLISTHVLEDADVADEVIMLSKGEMIKHTSISNFKKISKNKNLSEAFRILSNSTKGKK
ncbi:MAG: ABC transporter ATP-binding protein [Alphaproteobacteria bacterium]|nr:ABC transporter ATP-binding protein [Alphaproteobacteria bacterium]